VLDIVREQLNRRQPMDAATRNLIRLMTVTCGYGEVRLLAAQRMEMWLQNPKVGDPRAIEHYFDFFLPLETYVRQFRSLVVFSDSFWLFLQPNKAASPRLYFLYFPKSECIFSQYECTFSQFRGLQNLPKVYRRLTALLHY
jgi:hypothetical protein